MNESDGQHLSKGRNQTNFFSNVKSVSLGGGREIALFEISFLSYSWLQEKKGEEAAHN